MDPRAPSSREGFPPLASLPSPSRSAAAPYSSSASHGLTVAPRPTRESDRRNVTQNQGGRTPSVHTFPPPSSHPTETRSSQTNSILRTSTTRRKDRGRWKRNRSSPSRFSHFVVSSLTAVAACIVFLKLFYHACVVGTHRQTVSPSSISAMRLPTQVSFSSFHSHNSFPLPSVASSLLSGRMHRRLAETPSKGSPQNEPEICQTQDESVGESNSSQEGERRSEDTLTSETGGTGKGGTSSARPGRSKPVHETGEDEAQDEDTLEPHHGQDDEEVRMMTEGGMTQSAELEKSDYNNISEEDMDALLREPELIPTPDHLVDFYKFYSKLFQRLSNDALSRFWITRRAVSAPKVNTMLRKLAAAMYTARQFKAVRKVLPPCSAAGLETAVAKDAAALEEFVRGTLLKFFGEEITSCVDALQSELFFTAFAASRGVHGLPRQINRFRVTGFEATNAYHQRLMNHASELALRLSGRRPVGDWAALLKRRPDISQGLPETSQLKLIIAADATESKFASRFPLELFTILSKGGGSSSPPQESINNPVTPLFSDVIRISDLSPDFLNSFLAHVLNRRSRAIRHARRYMRLKSNYKAMNWLLCSMTTGIQLLSESLIVRSLDVADSSKLLRAEKRMRKVLNNSWLIFGVNPHDIRRLEEILATHASEKTLDLRQQLAAEGGAAGDVRDLLAYMVQDAIEAVRKLDLLGLLQDASHAENILEWTSRASTGTSALLTVLRDYEQDGREDSKDTSEVPGQGSTAEQSEKALTPPEGSTLIQLLKRRRPVREAREEEVEDGDSVGTHDGLDKQLGEEPRKKARIDTAVVSEKKDTGTPASHTESAAAMDLFEAEANLEDDDGYIEFPGDWMPVSADSADEDTAEPLGLAASQTTVTLSGSPVPDGANLFDELFGMFEAQGYAEGVAEHAETSLQEAAQVHEQTLVGTDDDGTPADVADDMESSITSDTEHVQAARMSTSPGSPRSQLTSPSLPSDTGGGGLDAEREDGRLPEGYVDDNEDAASFLMHHTGVLGSGTADPASQSTSQQDSAPCKSVQLDKEEKEDVKETSVSPSGGERDTAMHVDEHDGDAASAEEHFDISEDLILEALLAMDEDGAGAYDAGASDDAEFSIEDWFPEEILSMLDDHENEGGDEDPESENA
ncbi:putative transmembrane protein [Toxoplasma gondii p89]|uniref:Putative transmembrane protein n=1 Tax=Toxoplasma gondii p89 TaxID=943119 RepID=A0A086JDU1_TOXGO|nr:putative transmembrane protein [Toxoplasma gondii p89]